MDTAGIATLPAIEQAEILRRVSTFNAFGPDNDRHDKHDFGSFEYDGKTVLWKIGCYGRVLHPGSTDPSDEAVAIRVLTVMLVEGY